MTIDSSPEALLLLHSDEMIALRYVCTDNHKYKKKKEKKKRECHLTYTHDGYERIRKSNFCERVAG